MSPAQLAERLPERFRVLAGSRRATDPRHRTLRDLVQWSYELLTEPEQRVFERLSTFAGFVRPRARRAGVRRPRHRRARRVGSAGRARRQVDGGRRTVRVAHAVPPTGDPARVREGTPHGTAESAAVHGAHARVHVELAEQAGAGLGGPDEARWADELDIVVRRHARGARLRARRRRRRPRVPPRRRAARVRVAAHPLRAAGVGRRDRRHAGRRPITRSIRSRSASSRTAGSCAASSTRRSRPASERSPPRTGSARPRPGSPNGDRQRALLPRPRSRSLRAGWTA